MVKPNVGSAPVPTADRWTHRRATFNFKEDKRDEFNGPGKLFNPYNLS